MRVRRVATERSAGPDTGSEAGPATGRGVGGARRRRAWALRASGVAAVLLLAGCAAMPDSGPAGSVPSEAPSDAQADQVVVYAVPPEQQEQPAQLLSGFLDDLISDEPDYATAREYLAPGTQWNPQQRVLILDNVTVQDVEPTKSEQTAGRMTIKVTGRELARLDDRASYLPASAADRDVSVDFGFSKVKGQWRISSLPQGVVLNRVDFQRIYQSVDLYYPAAAGQTDGGVPPLVPDSVFLRSRIDPLASAVEQLLAGPSRWLAPVVASAFPAGSRLQGEQVPVSSGGVARVTLDLPSGTALDTDSAQCRAMAAQLYATLTQVNTQQSAEANDNVESVQVYRGHGGGYACAASSASPYDATQSAAAQSIGYYVGSNGKVWSMRPGQDSARPQQVPGVLLPPGQQIGSFAVSPTDDGQVATVTADGRSLYLSALSRTTAPTAALFTDSAKGALSTPSWDGVGTVWVADTAPGGKVLAAVDGHPAQVTVEGLSGQVTAVRAAADGTRLALVVKQGGHSSVELVRVRRGGTAAHPQLTLEASRGIAPGVTAVTALSWYDGDSLILLAQSATAPANSLEMVELDGSPSVASSTTGQLLDGMQQVSALQNGLRVPLLASNASDKSPSKIWELPPSSNKWAFIANGSQPTYPG